MIRVVLDTNLYVSALINGNSRRRLNLVLSNPRFEVITDNALLSELSVVIFRPKFVRFVSTAQIKDFLKLLSEKSLHFETTSVVRHSPDPKDDFLLALCKDSSSDYLITGNKRDLLDLKRFGKTEIVTLSQFLDLYEL
ncbi:putative PIN family toxin of toxin-antitoxin system [Dyadobacter sp. BE34]|uniref:PIN family toxin of toxin-antitoxin system n=1 Tax=Dyadobacter fermentans TaxID=94254 RepID=A0ABU1R600_9BACT|nr:putative PIN family toxin of toxin-antitoxin system [Dyadobacter fermentans]MDR7046521.1 putative PIN family toxin of toxin-antitoxin system [Dyadobacter sp. BE242]MDR7200834.1 putative PIN family toxin of toxin-antitoxin system [Dyadobacter sp. BE34]MDR7218794.1 putative PIN family toxin of toxin-antitoxin system [Dyadobacter sp. BE31]MDR7266724.1 putative PIN family toxin of toxin-antitoxin system [Dyadobacter sp. BE32]